MTHFKFAIRVTYATHAHSYTHDTYATYTRYTPPSPPRVATGVLNADGVTDGGCKTNTPIPANDPDAKCPAGGAFGPPTNPPPPFTPPPSAPPFPLGSIDWDEVMAYGAPIGAGAAAFIGGLIALWVTYKGVKCACECACSACSCCYRCICCKGAEVKPEPAPKAVEVAPVKEQPSANWAAPSPNKIGGRQGEALEVADIESMRN